MFSWIKLTDYCVSFKLTSSCNLAVVCKLHKLNIYNINRLCIICIFICVDYIFWRMTSCSIDIAYRRWSCTWLTSGVENASISLVMYGVICCCVTAGHVVLYNNSIIGLHATWHSALVVYSDARWWVYSDVTVAVGQSPHPLCRISFTSRVFRASANDLANRRLSVEA